MTFTDGSRLDWSQFELVLLMLVCAAMLPGLHVRARRWRWIAACCALVPLVFLLGWVHHGQDPYTLKDSPLEIEFHLEIAAATLMGWWLSVDLRSLPANALFWSTHVLMVGAVFIQ